MKKIVALFLVVLMMLSVAACGGANAPAGSSSQGQQSVQATTEAATTQKAPAKSVTIKVGNPAGWAQTAPYKDMLGDFESKTGIKVEFVDLGFDVIENKEILAATGGSGEFDVFALAWLTEPRMEPYQVTLNDYIKKDFGSVDQWKNSFYERIGRDFGDEVKNVTFHINSQYGIYRKALFDDPKEQSAFKAKYGYDLAPPKDLSQLTDIARFFTRDTNGDGKTDLYGLAPVAGPGNVQWLFADWCYQFGVEFFKEDGTIPFKSGKDYENTVKVATCLRDLAVKYKAMPAESATEQFAETASKWKDGVAAMSYGYWGDYWRSFADPSLTGKIGETGSFTMEPEANGSDFGGYWSYSISKDSKNPDAAWEYMKWTASKDVALKVADSAGLSPAVAEYGQMASDKGYVAPALFKNLGRLKGAPRIPEMNTIFGNFEPILTALLTGSLSPEEAVKEMITSTEDIMKKGGYIK